MTVTAKGSGTPDRVPGDETMEGRTEPALVNACAKRAATGRGKSATGTGAPLARCSRMIRAVLLALLIAAAPLSAAAARGIPHRSGGPAVHTILDVGHALEPGDYVWDDDGAPAGATHIVVDVARRQLYVYRGGVEIGRSFAVAGPPENPTPLGRFPILEKDADKYSRSYDAAMPYALRLTRSYVAIHGSKVEWDWVTHGCIGVPLPFARILFRNVRVGDEVLVTRNWLPAAYD